MRTDVRNTALKKYRAMIMVDENGKECAKADDILSLPWEEYAELIAMHNLPQVDYLIKKESPYSLLSLMMHDISMKQTILLWLSVSAVLIGSSIHNPHKVLPAIIGRMSWLGIEYGYHRFIGHMPVIGELTKQASFKLHEGHHFAPKDIDHVLLPPFFVFLIAAAVYQFVFVHISQNPEVTLASTILSCLLYDVMHYAMHAFHMRKVSEVPLVGGLLGRLWGHHTAHHIRPESNISVTAIELFLLDDIVSVYRGNKTESRLSVEQTDLPSTLTQ